MKRTDISMSITVCSEDEVNAFGIKMFEQRIRLALTMVGICANVMLNQD